MWALDVLAEAGIAFDSSIFPVRNWRYGVPDYSRRPLRVDTSFGPLLEFPLPTRRILGRNLPATGGAYFRLYPYNLTRLGIRRINAEGHPAVVYLHPWEFDPDQPHISGIGAASRFRHYVNLAQTESRLRQMLRDFEFGPIAEVFELA